MSSNCLKKENEVPKLSDEQGNLILEHLQGEKVNDEWIITDVRDVNDENLSEVANLGRD